MAKIRKQKSRDLSNKKLKNTDTPGTQITLFKIFFIPLREGSTIFVFSPTMEGFR